VPRTVLIVDDHDALERVGGQGEEALGGDERRAVLALLGDDRARAPAQQLARRAHDRGALGQLADLGVVEHQAVDALDHLHEVVARDVDPEVQGEGGGPVTMRGSDE
jgi:hypothetical protein